MHACRSTLEDPTQKLEAVGRLAGGIAHDFNNLLTVITGFVQMVLNGLPASDPRALDLREVQRAATRAAELTGQLLAFSRKQVLQPAILDVDAVVHDMQKMLGRVIGERVQLRTEPHAAGARINADRGQVEQVLMNLVVNARDAMPDGGTITIHTGIAELDEAFARQQVDAAILPGRYVRIDVRDTGIGMDESVRARIFEPFFTTKPAGTGTGLGLPMAYGIVSQSGGHITVETAPDRGTTVSLYLPAVGGEPVPASRPADPTPAGSETVLLVEDEDAVRDVARRALELHGYRVLAARHAADALAIASTNLDGIDVLLTDLVMPGMGGRALARRLLSERPALPVLFMSGYTDDAVLREGGADATIVLKPFTVDGLAASVRAALDRARRR